MRLGHFYSRVNNNSSRERGGGVDLSTPKNIKLTSLRRKSNMSSYKMTAKNLLARF
jgi:hypothetical protein